MASLSNTESEALILIKSWFKSYPETSKQLFSMPMEEFIRLSSEYTTSSDNKPDIKTAVATVMGSWLLSSNSILKEHLKPKTQGIIRGVNQPKNPPALTSLAMYFDIPLSELEERVSEYRSILAAECGLTERRRI